MKSIILFLLSIALGSGFSYNWGAQGKSSIPEKGNSEYVCNLPETNSPDLQCNCNQSFDGEPTIVSGYVHYDPIPLVLTCGVSGINTYVSYNNLTVKNRVRVLTSTGQVVVSTSGYVSGTGQLNFCASSSIQYYLQVSAYSPTSSLDRWNATVVCGNPCP